MATKNKPKKPFQTYNQQLKILRKRGLEIKNGSNAIKTLKRNNYYNIINGYKDIFLETTGENERFYNGTTFEHINALSTFDKKIRHLFLYYILDFETLIKTKISHYHTEEYDEIFNYLDVNNFTGEAEKITSLIAKISSEIKNHTNGGKQNAFSHYIKEHGELPLWVLFQKSSFGTASFFFTSLQNNVKQKICDELNEEHSKRYKTIISEKIDAHFLENTIHFINSYRNICAHNERFYNSIFHKKRFKPNYSKYSKIEFRGSIFDLMIILKLFLLKNDYKDLTKKFNKYLEELKTKLSDNPEAFHKIKNSCLRVPNEWQNILENFWK